MPLSAKEKQAAYRQRQSEAGLSEVRGIYLPPDLHAALKAAAQKLLKKSLRPPARQNAGVMPAPDEEM